MAIIPIYKRTKEDQEIYQHGLLAGERGQPHYDNPYDETERKHMEWLDGWRLGTKKRLHLPLDDD